MYTSAVIEIEDRAKQLSYEERLWLIERLVHGLRVVPAISDNFEAQIALMANDPDIQREIAAINAEFAAADMDGLK